MNLYLIEHSGSKSSLLIHFGIGLIGNSIYEHLKGKIAQEIRIVSIWETNNIANEIQSIILYINHSKIKFNQIEIIWSAGKGGFFMDSSQTNTEFEYFQKSVNSLKTLKTEFRNCFIHFHLISSAGGLFENQGFVDVNSSPIPLRPYGLLKLRMENFLLNQTSFNKKSIYRLSSVYSISNFRNRMGLIPRLIINSIKNEVTNIFGSETTLRDYVLDNDIGRFISNNITESNAVKNGQTEIYHLVSCKPSSIFEIKIKIERIINRKIPLSYEFRRSNNGNMTYSNRLKPSNFKTTDLTQNLHSAITNILYSNMSNHILMDVNHLKIRNK